MSIKNKDGVGRGNLFKIRPHDIIVVPGFNIRLDDEDRSERIECYAALMAAGSRPPPILVRADQQDNIYLIDGHMRLAAANLCIERGIEIQTLDAVQHTGNNIDHVVAMLSSGEARTWKPIEVAEGYKRLISFGLSEQDIATKCGKSVNHVRDILLLGNSDSPVQNMVKSGDISASLAISTIKSGDNDVQSTLEKASAIAKSDGSKKVKPRHIDQARGVDAPKSPLSPLREFIAEYVEGLGITDAEFDDREFRVPGHLLRPIMKS